MKIKKAVIPCGGMGTRFLPVTKSIPKEILPVIDTPVLAYIVNEIVESGIDEVLIVLGKGKSAIKEFFTPNIALEAKLKDKPILLETIKTINKNASIQFVMQLEPRGSGDAVALARSFTRNEPFCMSNGDDLIVAEEPVTLQLAKAYESAPAVILGVQKVPQEEACKYGIIKPKSINGRFIECAGIIEKPQNPPSVYAALGRYVLTPEIYEYIDSTVPVDGEVRLTDAIQAMMRDGKVYSYEFEGRRYDMGDKFGAVTATVDFALKRADMKDRVKEYLINVLKNAD